MIEVAVSGALGKMGKAVIQQIKEQKNMKVIAGFDIVTTQEGDLYIYDNLYEIPKVPNVIIDFSNPSAIKKLTDYASSNGVALVIGTTGLEKEHKNILYGASKTVPVFVSQNMSLGIALLLNLTRQITSILKDYDIEIIEKHHNQKIDAPSGTALMIADVVKKVRPSAESTYSRANLRRQRAENEVGIHSVRGGTTVGEHTVLFMGEDETIEISHKIISRKVLAIGAVKVINFISKQKPGYYTMQDLIDSMKL